MDDTPISSAEEDANALRMRNAQREADPHDFGAAEEALNDAAKRVNGIWIAFILLCVYIFIATYTVTPAALFRDTPVRLPIFNADLPLKVYFVMAPVLILAVHAYLIVLTKGLAEKIGAYEEVLSRSRNMSAINPADERALRTRLDNSIVVRALSAGRRDARGVVDHASGFIAGLTMTVTPVALLLLTQLVFLPYQDQWLTWVHRFFGAVDVGMCLWLLWPLTPWRVMAKRSFVLAFILFAAMTSVFFAAFPGETIYTWFDGRWPHVLTVEMFEGPLDPVDYVHKGGVLPFPNRLILPDDPKLAENAGASAGVVSLSVRGRNFRKAVFDRSNLARVDFSATDLEGASLRGAKLEGAKFECATPATVINRDDGPSGAYDSTYTPQRDCTQLGQVNLSTANLDGASFRGARMNGANLESTVVKNAAFSGAELLGARFTNAQGSAGDFSSALLMGADFRNAQLRAANFEGAGLQGARFSNSTLQAAHFSNAYIQGVDMSGASLQGASFQKTFLQAATFYGAKIQGASFKSAALPNASLECAEFFRSDFKNANLDQTIMTPRIEKKCEGYRYYYSEISPYYSDDIRHKYNIPTDALPRDSSYDTSWDGSDGWGTYSDYPDFISELQHPEKLDANTFAAVLKKATSDLPDDAKARVRDAFERLKPDARTKAQDDAEKAFWTDWAKKSATEQSAKPESHAKALAARLEDIACVGEGAPHVARGLLRAGRFDRLYEDKETNEKEKNRILERLRKASGGDDPSCLGAKGLVKADFPKPAP